ncbi:MAG: response regulator [Candidatus Aenigmarchaeota archaeon]|nr:response regulator [Candidatus Aenigmarchaeota archaeon]
MMPDIDGFQVCDRLKSNEGTRSIPVVMLTAKGEAMDVARAFNCEADDYLVKPYDPHVLQVKVAKNLRTQPVTV